tara:strand:+ start:1340 stop:2233 length:894 start_codon:yes stop_codon:yes gene_type:complete
VSKITPDFTFVGATRSAGLYITKILMSHPDIFIGAGAGSIAERKNLNFYNDDLTDPYFQQFKGHKDKILGESKRNYYLYKKSSDGKSVAHKIFDMNPNMKILISLRNPIHRAFSHYIKISKQGLINSPRGLIEDYNFLLANEPNSGYYSISRVITDSLYHENVKNYIDLFSKRKVKIIIHHDELWFKDWKKARPQETFEEIFNFLGVDSNFVSPLLSSQVNTLSMAIQGRSSPLLLFYRLLNRLGFYKLSRHMFSYVPKSPQINEKTYVFLLEKFMDDIVALEKLLNIDLSSWKRYK